MHHKKVSKIRLSEMAFPVAVLEFKILVLNYELSLKTNCRGGACFLFYHKISKTFRHVNICYYV